MHSSKVRRSWCNVPQDGRSGTTASAGAVYFTVAVQRLCCLQQQLEGDDAATSLLLATAVKMADAATSLLHATVLKKRDVVTSLLHATVFERCDAVTSLASLVPTSLVSLVLTPKVFLGACANPRPWARPEIWQRMVSRPI